MIPKKVRLQPKQFAIPFRISLLSRSYGSMVFHPIIVFGDSSFEVFFFGFHRRLRRRQSQNRPRVPTCHGAGRALDLPM